MSTSGTKFRESASDSSDVAEIVKVWLWSGECWRWGWEEVIIISVITMIQWCQMWADDAIVMLFDICSPLLTMLWVMELPCYTEDTQPDDDQYNQSQPLSRPLIGPHLTTDEMLTNQRLCYMPVWVVGREEQAGGWDQCRHWAAPVGTDHALVTLTTDM